jgi:hypothetical protein
MQPNISKQLLIDHHAHLLRSDFMLADAIELRRAFSESHSLSQLEKHLTASVSYMSFISEIEQFLDLSGGEDALLQLRERMKEAEYVNLLLDDASIAAFIIDDGFTPSQRMSITRFGAMTERPVFRARRIEVAIEEAMVKSKSMEQLEEIFPKVLFDSEQVPIVALKCIAAYRGGLDIRIVDRSQATASFTTAKDQLIVKGHPRVGRSDLYHYLLLRAFALAAEKDIPVQVHSGIGDQDQDIRTANPACMRDVLESSRFNQTRFVFLHCYPFAKEAAYLASIYGNVYMDVSLTPFIASPAVSSSFDDALSVAPTTKILAATDGHSQPETYWYAALMLRRGLATALERMIDEGFVDKPSAEVIAGRILHGNALSLYKLTGLI